MLLLILFPSIIHPLSAQTEGSTGVLAEGGRRTCAPLLVVILLPRWATTPSLPPFSMLLLIIFLSIIHPFSAQAGGLTRVPAKGGRKMGTPLLVVILLPRWATTPSLPSFYIWNYFSHSFYSSMLLLILFPSIIYPLSAHAEGLTGVLAEGGRRTGAPLLTTLLLIHCGSIWNPSSTNTPATWSHS